MCGVSVICGVVNVFASPCWRSAISGVLIRFALWGWGAHTTQINILECFTGACQRIPGACTALGHVQYRTNHISNRDDSPETPNDVGEDLRPGYWSPVHVHPSQKGDSDDRSANRNDVQNPACYQPFHGTVTSLSASPPRCGSQLDCRPAFEGHDQEHEPED